MSRPDRLRGILIAILVVAAVLSVVGNKTHSAWLGWLSFVAFLCAVVVYFSWRRAVLAKRRGAQTPVDEETDDPTC
jgi:uncharacterized membrane protein YccC